MFGANFAIIRLVVWTVELICFKKSVILICFYIKHVKGACWGMGIVEDFKEYFFTYDIKIFGDEFLLSPDSLTEMC